MPRLQTRKPKLTVTAALPPSKLLPEGLTTPVAWDTETSSLYPDEGGVSVVSVAWFEDNILDADHIRTAAWPVCQGEEGKPGWSGQDTLFGSGLDINISQREWEYLTNWLSRQKLVAHNAQFDLIMTGAGPMEYRFGAGHGVDLLDNTVWDTMIASTLIWPRSNKALKDTAERLWGVKERTAEQDVKAWLKKHKHKIAKGVRYDLVPWELMEIYAAKDAGLTLRLWLEQVKKMDPTSHDYEHFKGVLMPVMKQLVRMERRGLPYSVYRSRIAAGEVEVAKQKLASKLPFKATGADAKVFFFGDPDKDRTARGKQPLGLRAIKVSDKTGEPSLDVDVLRELCEAEVQWAKDWQIYTMLDRSQSMYYNGYADKTALDGRLRARIRQFGTVSSRFSIERANLQAMPHDGRLEGLSFVGLDHVLTPRQLIGMHVKDTMPGWSLWEFDLSQAELRVGALLSDCVAMLTEYAKGLEADLHTFTAQNIGCDRKVGKMANFLLLYGGGADMMREQITKMTAGAVKLTSREAKAIHYGFHRSYPEIARAVEDWDNYVDRRGYAPLVGGQKSWFRYGEDSHKGWNRRVQGSIAQFFLQFLLMVEGICVQERVHEAALDCGIGGAGPLMCVHDSTIVLLPNETAEHVGNRIMSEGKQLWDDFFGFIGDGVPGFIDSKEFTK